MIKYLVAFSLLLVSVFPATLYADSVNKEEVSNIEAAEIGKELALAMDVRNFVRLDELFSINRFSERAARTTTDNLKEIRAFKAGFIEGVEQNKNGLFSGVLADNQARAKFIRVLGKNKPIIRLDQSQGGAGYIYFVLEKNNGKVVATDFFTFANNSFFSDQVGKVTSLMMRPSKSLLKRTFGLEEVDNDLVDKLKMISRYKISGQPLAALNVIEDLPKNVLETEIILLQAIELAPPDDPRYEQFTNKYIEVVSEDKVASMMLIDYYIMKNQFKKAEDAIFGLEKQVGGSDDFTELLKVNIALLGGDYQKVIVLAEKVNNTGVLNEGIYWSLLNAYVMTRDYENAIKGIKNLENKFGYAFVETDFHDDEIWSDLINTNEFETYFNDR